MGRALLVAGAILGFFLLAAVAWFTFVDPNSAAEDWQRQVNTAVRQLARDYTLPVAEARPRTVVCKYVRPGENVPECAEYVEALSGYSENLASIKERLSYLAQEAPNGVSAQQMEDVNEMAAALAILMEANDLLVSGWAEADRTQWAKGWQRTEDAGTAMGQVFE